jgi:uncharacterized protein
VILERARQSTVTGQKTAAANASFGVHGAGGMASFLSPFLRDPAAARILRNVRTGGVVADHVLTAFDSASRRKGLLGLDSLPEGAAMIIAPSNAVHTFFMKFPIDIAFVSKDGRVLKTRHAVPARRLAASLRAFAVIELPGGTLARSRTEPGDMLELVART